MPCIFFQPAIPQLLPVDSDYDDNDDLEDEEVFASHAHGLRTTTELEMSIDAIINAARREAARKG